MRPGGQPDMQQLMKQAQKMQQELLAAQEELAAAEVTGSAGGELVTVTLTGSGDVVAAIRDAQRAVNELAATTMGPVTGGLGGGLGLPGF